MTPENAVGCYGDFRVKSFEYCALHERFQFICDKEKIQKLLDETVSQMANNYANVRRIIEWSNDPNRKPAKIAFTEGPERQIAYLLEMAWEKK